VNNPKPWFPFYVADHYRSGIMTQCSLPAAGLYLRLLAISWDSPILGTILDNSGHPFSEIELAKKCAISDQEFNSGLKELINLGILIINSDNSVRIKLMDKLTFPVTHRKRALTRERVARYRHRRKAILFSNAVTPLHVTENFKEKEPKRNSLLLDYLITPFENTAPENFGNASVTSEIEKWAKIKSGNNSKNGISVAVAKIIGLYPAPNRNIKKTAAIVADILQRVSFLDLQEAVQRFVDEKKAEGNGFIFSEPAKWFLSCEWQKHMGKNKSEIPKKQEENNNSQAEEIYEIYPRKIGKAAALKKIEKAIGLKGFDYLYEATKEFAKRVMTWPEADRIFVPHPVTWFNQGRYDDDRELWWGKRGNPKNWGPKQDPMSPEWQPYDSDSENSEIAQGENANVAEDYQP